MTVTVVALHDGRPPLTDIPGRLRFLAQEIENGEVEAETAYVILPVKDDYPRLRGFGNVDGDAAPIPQVALLQHWLLANMVKRV